MNDTVLNIPGIKIIHELVNLEDSTDQANIIVIKDGHNNEVRITTCFGKITSSEFKTEKL